MKSDQEGSNVTKEGNTTSNVYYLTQPEAMEEDPFMALMKGRKLKPVTPNNSDNVITMRIC
ncbi:hypothetical protein H1224_18100 [Pectobacterium aroidearum]|uniref:hypothetical protein n=1 Tax=Pectobacterium aroidearum TaxID=1201031 RepID=UPI0015F37E65|nr:hypothetical protein [Pectobacterium aroidearum]MBA5602963.1 hypothetical protein [Pectobacterium aroidearum]